MTTFEQPSSLESLQMDLANEIAISDQSQRSAEKWDPKYAAPGILAEMRIKRLERMIKTEKKRLAAEAADAQARMKLATVVVPDNSYEFEEG